MGLLYSFDTSALLNGRRDLLPPEVFPSLWVNIDVMIAEGQIRCVDVVKHELAKKDDAVLKWAGARSKLFVPLEEDIQMATRRVLREHPKLTGVGAGRNAADPFVIGLALARSCTVVTEERRTGNVTRPKIPDVCDALDVPCISLVEFLRNQGWSF